MINLATFEKLQLSIRDGVNRVNKLEFALKTLNEAWEALEEIRGDGYCRLDESIYDAQDTFENLTAHIASEIKQAKNEVDRNYRELECRIFLDAEKI